MSVISQNTAKDLAKMSGGSYGKSGDVLSTYVWDTLLFPAAPRDFDFFTVPIGGPFGNGVKSNVETNLQVPGQLPSGQAFLCRLFRLDLVNEDRTNEFSAGVVRDFYQVLNLTRWIFKLPAREYEWEAPGTVFAPAVHEVGAAAAANQNRVGDYNSHSWIKLDTDIPVGELVAFKVNAHAESGDSTLSTNLAAAFTALNAKKVGLRFTIKVTLARSK